MKNLCFAGTLLLAACGGTSGTVDQAPGASPDLLSTGAASDLSLPSAGDLAIAHGGDLSSGGGDMAVGAGATVSGINCFATGGGYQCPKAMPYGYYCFALNGPEPGCVPGKMDSTFCCPDKLCVSYTSGNNACGGKPGTPSLYSCQPGLTPTINGCVSNGMGGGMDGYCCP